MKIAFLLGSAEISGGTYVIFEHAIRINRRSKISVIIVTEKTIDKNKDLQWHPEARELTWATYEKLQNIEIDLVIATWWRTVYDLYRISAKQYCYFVQSIESKFYIEKEQPLRKLVDSTYQLNLPIITEATWIKDFLFKNFGCECYLVKNGIRKDIYSVEGNCILNREDGKLRVLIEGPLNVPFKNVEKALELCHKSMADEVWLLTCSKVSKHKYANRVFSQVPIFDTPLIYRSCDIIVKLSYVEGMFGPPLEMFHCGGTAITYDVTGHDEYMRHKYNSYIVAKDDEKKVVHYINFLKRHPDVLLQLKQNAINTASSWYDWDTSSLVFEESLKKIMKQTYLKQDELERKSKFFFDWYILAENYRLATTSRLLKKAKSKLKQFKVKFFG